MEYDAVAIGSQDLAAGVDALLGLEKKAHFPFLSANLVDTQSGLLFKPLAEINRSGMRIAIIGLTGQANLPESCSDSLEILPWQQVLPQAVATVSATSDLIILLSSLTVPENREIAQQMTDIHIIFQSGASKQNMRPQLINNTLITQAGYDGRYQGQLSIEWNTARKWQESERPLLALQKEYDRLGWLINRVRKKGGPQHVYKGDMVRQEAFSQKTARYAELEAEIKLLARTAETETSSPATYNNHFHPLPPSLPDDGAILKILQESRKKANQVRRMDADMKRLDQYIGNHSCQSCHETIYQAWAGTRHANAYQTLKERDQNNNFTCVYCHVTGLDEHTAYLAPSLPEPLKAIGCEACHGPSKQHADDPTRSTAWRPDSRLCATCHNDERDDSFNFEHDKEKIH